MINLNAWFQKHDLCAENILYIYRKDRKTVIQRTCYNVTLLQQ